MGADQSVQTPEVDAVLREASALTAALARARRIRRLLLLAVVIFVAVLSYFIYQEANHFMSPQYSNELMNVAQKRLEENQNQYMKEVEGLYRRNYPIITEAFYSQAKQDMPRFLQEIEKERDTLAQSLQGELEKRLDKRYEQLVAQHQKTIDQELPAAQNEVMRQRMTKNLTIAVQKVSRKYYIEDLNNELQTLFKTWDEFPPAKLPAKGDPPIDDQLLSALLEVLQDKLAHR
jgi:4-amino-4-deoxy-L-arabinose transferase-like glycosyltransferase